MMDSRERSIQQVRGDVGVDRLLSLIAGEPSLCYSNQSRERRDAWNRVRQAFNEDDNYAFPLDAIKKQWNTTMQVAKYSGMNSRLSPRLADFYRFSVKEAMWINEIRRSKNLAPISLRIHDAPMVVPAPANQITTVEEALCLANQEALRMANLNRVPAIVQPRTSISPLSMGTHSPQVGEPQAEPTSHISAAQYVEMVNAEKERMKGEAGNAGHQDQPSHQNGKRREESILKKLLRDEEPKIVVKTEPCDEPQPSASMEVTLSEDISSAATSRAASAEVVLPAASEGRCERVLGETAPVESSDVAMEEPSGEIAAPAAPQQTEEDVVMEFFGADQEDYPEMEEDRQLTRDEAFDKLRELMEKLREQDPIRCLEMEQELLTLKYNFMLRMQEFQNERNNNS